MEYETTSDSRGGKKQLKKDVYYSLKLNITMEKGNQVESNTARYKHKYIS